MGTVLSTPRNLTDSQITWLSGTVAGLVATFAKQPIQRAKWIKQTESHGSRSFRSIVSETMMTHGWRGFFSGSVAAICRNVPHSALVYSLYPHFAKMTTAKMANASEESFGTRFAAGYVTMIAATCVTHPMDTLRVKLSVSPTKTNFSTTFMSIYRLDGLKGFYSGFGATLLGAGPRGAIGFSIFETAKPIAAEKLSNRPALGKFLCGYVAGLIAESVVYPLDTVRRRQQALGSATPVTNMNPWAAISYIVRHEGFSGLFKGIALNLMKNPAGVAVSFAVNDFVKDALGYGIHDQPPEIAAPTTPGPSRRASGGSFFG